MTRGWGEGRWLCLDTESTGVNVDEDRIVTACAAIVDNGEVVYQKSWLVAVDVEIPAEAEAVHGISTAKARADGIPVEQGIREFAGAVKFAIRAGFPVLAFNAPFDLTMLDREVRRTLDCGLADFCGGPIGPVIDPLVIDKHVDRYRPGSRKLVDTAALFGVDLGDAAHDATADALAAAEVARRMWQRTQLDARELRAMYADRRYPAVLAQNWQQLGRLTVGQLHDQQIGWYAEQSKSFAQYLRQQANEKVNDARKALDRGDDETATIAQQDADELHVRADGVHTVWPMQPFAASVESAKAVAA